MASQGGSGTTTEAVGEGEDEESSSSSSSETSPAVGSLFDDAETPKFHQQNNFAESTKTAKELDDFRVKWKAELKTRRGGESSPSRSALEAPISLYQQGIAYEQRGLMHEAVRCYRRAIHLVPDIEDRFYQLALAQQQKKAQQNVDTAMGCGGAEKCVGGEENSPDDWSCDDKVAWFESCLYSTENDGRKVYCFVENEQQQQQNRYRHISELPTEVLLNIFKWVVSSELDLRQLEQLSLVCRGFYVLARQAELWRLSCLRVWGLRLGGLEDEESSVYLSWRDMYLNRPHPLFNGVYISRMTYIRHGESTFQDYNYRPWHMVVYYRYIRFFADGTLSMVTTPDEPQLVVPCMRTKQVQHSAALKGTYQYLDKDCIDAVLRRPKRNWNDSNNIMSYFARRRNAAHESSANDSEQVFNLEFRISSNKRRKQCCLNWLGYQVCVRHRNGQEARSQFVLTDQKFPPMYFSRVRSYAACSEHSL